MPETAEVFRRTGQGVRNATNGRQMPAVYNQFFDQAFLGGAPGDSTRAGLFGTTVRRLSWGAAQREDSEYSVNGFSDWRLPTRPELRAMDRNLHQNGIGEVEADMYWTSEERYNEAWRHDCSDGRQHASSEPARTRVRLVRAF